MTIESIQILLIEDVEEDARVMRELLSRQSDTPFELKHADRLSNGLDYLKHAHVDLILLDLNLPESKGLETLEKVAAAAPRLPIVILTSGDDPRFIAQALQRGAQDYLVKGYVQVYPNLLWRAIRYSIDRERARAEIRVAHAHNETLLASIPSILIGVDSVGLITHWNAIAEKTFGLSRQQSLHQPLAHCGVRWDAGPIGRAMESCRRAGAPVSIDDIPFERPDGTEGFLGFTIAPIQADYGVANGFLLFGADITERKQTEAERAQLQEQLAQAQKMEVIGRFAGSIAHDFNNFLQVILGFAMVIRAHHQQDTPLLNDVNEIINAGESAADVVRQLLAFSRRQTLQPRVVDLNRAVQDMTRLLERFVGERIQVVLDLASQPLPVKLDPTGLKQVIMNLAANARDAMPGGGRLAIRTGFLEINATFARARPWAKEGRFARLSIEDTGSGLQPEVAARLFEPFVTTKGVGRGTGLGLAVVAGLVQQHDGLIDVETAPGYGTVFHLYFPAQELPVEVEEPAPAELVSNRKAVCTGNGHGARRRILVVDDDAAIRMLCERILGPAYEVTTVDSGPSALDLLGREAYDLLLTDLKMPVMDGFALLEEASRLRPSLHMLAMTGSLTPETETRLLHSKAGSELLRKPFTPSMLEEAVVRAL